MNGSRPPQYKKQRAQQNFLPHSVWASPLVIYQEITMDNWSFITELQIAQTKPRNTREKSIETQITEDKIQYPLAFDRLYPFPRKPYFGQGVATILTGPVPMSIVEAQLKGHS